MTMLAPAEILQMEGEDFTPGRHSAKKGRPLSLSWHGSPWRAMTAGGGGWVSSFARSRLGLKSLAAAVLILAGVYFVGQAAFIQAKAVVAQLLLEQAWQSTLATGKPTKAWSWADTWPVARISFPTLNQSAVVLHEAGGEAMAFGPAHVAASAKPGAAGVSVIGGHRDTHFSFIKNLKVGDEIVIETPARATVRYRMTGSTIVHAGASGIATRAKSARLALVTCYPFDAVERGPLRYVVFAKAK